ncbi:MAG: hypothetical protein WCC26_16780 [Terracidiphilus sp.]
MTPTTPAQPLEPTASAAPEKLGALTAEHRRLQVLVGELLATNQALRFKVEQLEAGAESADRGLARACATAGMLLP